MRLLFLLFISLVGCANNDATSSALAEGTQKPEKSNQIVLIVEQSSDSSSSTLNYINKYFENLSLSLDSRKKIYSIPCDSLLLLKITFGKSVKKSKDIIAYKGDSIQITSSGLDLINRNIPSVQWLTLNDFYEFYNLHYPSDQKRIDSIITLLYKRKKIGNSENYFLEENRRISVEEKKRKYDLLLSAFTVKLNGYNVVLDSLLKRKEIEPVYKDWQLFNAKITAILQLQQVQFDLKNYDRITPLVKAFNLKMHEKELAVFPSYKTILGNLGLQNLAKLSNPISKSDIENNYIEIYDHIKDHFQDSAFITYVKFECLKRIRESESTNKFKVYLGKFYKEITDSVFINYAKNNLDVLFGNVADPLLNSSKIKIGNFDELITAKKQEKEILYIDLWASWCLPCIAVLPDSKKLREEYESKGIRFIYISIDKDFSKWKTANQLHGLSEYEYSFILGGNREEGLLKKFQINSIPRYLLYDQDKKLIHPDAPGPATPQIRQLFEKLLKEKKI